MTPPLLSVQDLTTSFRAGHAWRAVVRNLNFHVHEKETLAIVGESGSGKSVASMSVMRLLPERTSRVEGSVRLMGRELTTLDNEAMRQVRGAEIAMIFQEPMTSLNPVFSIGEQIAEATWCHGGKGRGAARAEALRLLDRVRMPNAKRRFEDPPHSFSGGMRQRVMIAMALAAKPKLLIDDEPTTALDVTIQGQILDLIKSVQDEEGMSVLFITHDMGVVAEVADRTLVMYRGEGIETGLTTDIFARPREAYTRLLIDAVPKLGALSAYDGPSKFPVPDQPPAPSPTPPAAGQEVPLLEVRNLTTRFEVRSGLLG